MATACKRILLIRPESLRGRSSDNVDALLAATSLSVDCCPDVYRGLARLCRAEGDDVRGVIVCVDGLGTAELAFFAIASRVRHGLDLLVYADDPSSTWIATALERGATGLTTERTIQALDAGADPLPATEVEAIPAATEPIADECEFDSDDDTTARVPWIRYDDQPLRGAPLEEEEPSEAPDAIKPAPTAASAYEPLLTDEELRALIGDDVAPMALDDEHTGAGETEEVRGDGSGAAGPEGGNAVS